MQLLPLLKELSLHPKNTEELKGLILQLAVEGKLTTNWRKKNPNISTNVDKLASAFNMTSEELFEHSLSIIELDIPKSWIKAKFSVVFDMKGGSQPPKSNFIDNPKEGYVQLYQIRDFGKKPQPVYVPVESVSKLCTTEDIMIGRYGASIGKVFYGKDGAYNVALVKLIWDNNILLQDFVYQMFSARIIQEFFQNCTRSAQAGFNKTDMGKLNITLPPLEEQKAIVEVVNALFKEVEQLEELTKERICLKEDFVTSALRRLTETDNTTQEWNYLQQHFSSFFTEKKNIKNLRETILQLAVEGKLTAKWREKNPSVENASELLKRIEAEKQQLIAEKKIKKQKPLPPIEDEDKPYDLPDGWGFARLGSIIKISSGDGLTSANMDKNGTIPVYGGNGITGYHSDYNVEKPEIVIGRVGYYCGSVHLSEDKAWVTDNAFITRFSATNIYRDFLVWLLKGTNLKADENATAQPVISGRKVYPIIVGLPPIEEQKAIVEKVNSLMVLCDELEQQVDNSQTQIEQLMQSCLKEVFEQESN
jgi:type I restriction enzyme, S subunit